MKILFMGTPDFARESLDNLYNAGFEICGVVTTPDRPAGRGMKLVASPVKEYAIEKNLKLFQPEKISNNDEFKNEIRELAPDLVCVVSYGVILPKSFLKIPPLGCINVHPSMLPKYRGPAPIQWAILNGDEKTGVSIMYLDAGMDSGDIITQEEVEIGEDETTGELWNRLSGIGARLLKDVVTDISNGKIVRTPQPEEFVLAPMLDKEMSKINWQEKTTSEIKNLVRGLNPIMGTYTFLNGKKIKMWKVQKYSNNEFVEKYAVNDIENKTSGTVLLANEKQGLFIKTIDGVLSVLEIQGENAKRMNIGDFLRGNKIEVGEKFE
ncbi:MAG: methionyl-tRNA formyltransferase [Clostridia bacterium]|nr:methionyl-tRNA formyltransferase [Clostridia bacterium]